MHLHEDTSYLFAAWLKMNIIKLLKYSLRGEKKEEIERGVRRETIKNMFMMMIMLMTRMIVKMMMAMMMMTED